MVRKLLAMTLIVLAGCVAGGHKLELQRDYQAAVAAQNGGDWDAARRAWARVVENGRASGEPPAQQAVYHYEYGRSLGITCHFDEAERELLQAYQLDVETDGPAYMSLTELARLNLDRQRNADAASYFERMLRETNEKVLEQAPAEHAVILDEYADALAGSGNPEQAEQMRAEADMIRSAHPHSQSVTDRTPYGRHCRQSN